MFNQANGTMYGVRGTSEEGCSPTEGSKAGLMAPERSVMQQRCSSVMENTLSAPSGDNTGSTWLKYLGVSFILLKEKVLYRNQKRFFKDPYHCKTKQKL